MEAKILQELARPWKVQHTMAQRGIRLVDLIAMEERARKVASLDGDVVDARKVAAYILEGRATWLH